MRTNLFILLAGILSFFGMRLSGQNLENVHVLNGDPVEMEGLYFAIEKAHILPRSYAVLDSFAEKLKAHPDWKIELGYHMGCNWSEEYGQDLGKKRAQSVVQYLADRGIPIEQLEPKRYNDWDHPCCNTCPEADRPRRRLEWKVLDFDSEKLIRQTIEVPHIVHDPASEMRFTSSSRPSLDALVAFLKQHPRLGVEIQADPNGPNPVEDFRYEKKLASQIEKEVIVYLIK
ncbi:MAG: OmpA family protein, partial [Bacteroidota bacterium]